jgi:hypothetical protein
LNLDIVFISKHGGNDLYLEVGDYSYPFQFALPINLPTSFEHTFGNVRYSLYATVDIPWAFDKHSTRSFTVISHYDLNSQPALRQPYKAYGTKVLCCGFCKSDPITAEFSIMKGGYVCGECIVFNATVDNRSSREIKSCTVNLIQHLVFHATTKSKRCTRTVALIKYPKKINAKTTETWSDSVLTIPPVCSSSNGTCRIIEVIYSVVFNFDASGMAISTDVSIPITIGTIPLQDSNNQTQHNLPYSFEASHFGAESNQMPPEFEQKGEVFESDANSFKPYYPYYKDFSIRNS